MEAVGWAGDPDAAAVLDVGVVIRGLPRCDTFEAVTDAGNSVGQARVDPSVMRPSFKTVVAGALALSFACLPPDWGANAILHPVRRPLIGGGPKLAHEDISFRTDDGLLLKGWLFRTPRPRRGLIVYLHGIADNRRSGIGVAERFVPKGWDVLTYDARAHGQSEGKDCTYGFREKHDVSRALDAVHADRAILFGSSLGGAVALQAAAVEPRVVAVIAQSAFSDLEVIVRERAPWFATRREVEEALALVEKRAGFRIADVSPRAAAAHIQVPVLLLHGAADRETLPAHSRRIYKALKGPRQLLIAPGAGHNDVLAREEVWQVVEDWLIRLDR